MSLLNDASLVMIPSGYKDTKLYSAKPTNGDGDFTFSRGSNLAATRVNSEGLIEKGRENLLLQSNSFDTTWFNTNTTESSGQAGYDGTNDAWLLSKSAASARIEQSVSQSGVQTFSLYIKANASNWVTLQAVGGANPYANFDLINGVVGVTNAVVHTSIEAVGLSGWYRCTMVSNVAITSVIIYPANGDNDRSATSGSIYIQDAQLENGLVATDYIETTTTTEQAGILEDMPRLDYSGGASCPSLLLEPQRTNLVTHSEYLGTYTLDGGTQSITSNYAISPEGVQNAARGQFDKTGVSYSRAYLSNSGTTGGVEYVFSVYLKANSGSPVIYLQVGPNFSTAIALTNEWQRYEVSGAASGSSTSVIIGVNDFVSGTTETADILIYGVQMEEASYPTSYIPTYGSSVTRSAEHKILTGNLLSKGIFDSTWTFLYDNTFVDVIREAACALVLFEDAGGSNSVRISLNSDGSYRLQDSENGVAANVVGNKILCRFNGSTIDWYVDGSEVASDSVTPSNFQSISVDDRSDYTAKPVKINKEIVFPTALTDAECIELTTI